MKTFRIGLVGWIGSRARAEAAVRQTRGAAAILAPRSTSNA